LRLYLDASVVVALVTTDVPTAPAVTYLRAMSPVLIVSDFAAVEFASVLARQRANAGSTPSLAREAFAALDAWRLRAAERIETTTADVMFAEVALRRLDSPLRTADAINIAIAQRARSTLMTFDLKMAAAAQALGIEVAAA